VSRRRGRLVVGSAASLLELLEVACGLVDGGNHVGGGPGRLFHEVGDRLALSKLEDVIGHGRRDVVECLVCQEGAVRGDEHVGQNLELGKHPVPRVGVERAAGAEVLEEEALLVLVHVEACPQGVRV